MYTDPTSLSGDPNRPYDKIGLFTKLLLKITGTEEETLRKCPSSDWQNVRAIGEIMLCTLVYQTALFTLIGYQLFAGEGQIRPDILGGGFFLGLFILLIDAYVIMRSSWELSGISELQRGGIDISGGRGARAKNNCFLGVRISLSIGMAQLTAIFVGLLVFGGDINSQLQDAYAKGNARLITNATTLVDGQMKRATEAVDAGTRHMETLQAQVASLRDDGVTSPQVRQAQQEVTDLIGRKVKAEDDVRTAEAFAANELGGIKGLTGNSGQAGRGARYRAAVEQVGNARNHAQQIAKELDAARSRLENARRQASIANGATQPRASEQLTAFEKALRDETIKLAGSKNELAKITEGREAAIRAAVDGAPDHVSYGGGFLNRLIVLDKIAHDSGRIAVVILLIDFVSFGFELAAVLAKVTAYVPTTYAKLLARLSFLQAVKIAEEITVELNASGASHILGPVPSSGAATESDPTLQTDPAHMEEPVEPPEADPILTPPPPPKRGRGRPRKHKLNGSESPAGQKGESNQETGET